MKKRATSKTAPASKTDGQRLDRLRDRDIDYSDIPKLSPEDFARGVVRWGAGERLAKEQITLRLDADVLRWFRALGKGYQSQINQLLRAYMDAHHGKAPARRG
jgi:uncharacterized protein (DUF4415 family)